MTDLHDVLEPRVRDGSLPGAVALVARGERVEVRAVGAADTAGGPAMARESIFRIASLTKPVTAAAVMTLVDEGRIALDDPVAAWLPELEEPVVVRTPGGPVDDTVPAARPITLADLLTFRAGYGFPADFSLPAVRLLVGELGQGPPQPQRVAPPDEWMAALSGVPLLYQPGEVWLYNTCSDILGVLVSRVADAPFGDVLAERLLEPLGMTDTGFAVPPGKLERFTTAYRPDPSGGGLVEADAPDGQWSSPPAFPSGAGGLVSTADDWYAFGRMLLAGGEHRGRRVLSPGAVATMTSNHLTASQRGAAELFLEGQGWGFGGSVDVEALDPWNVPGRYGWVGGTGTAAHIVPATGLVTVLLTQVELTGPTPPALMRAFWRYAAGA